jgi:hypothetical protein
VYYEGHERPASPRASRRRLRRSGGGGSSAAQPAAGRYDAAPAPHLDPYRAGVAYAECMRAHGVPHPDPDRNGDFHLTPAQERRMKTATPKQHEAADKACFHLLAGTVSTQPLSRAARQAALEPLRAVKRCMHRRGYELGTPIVKSLSRGRAMFGFSQSPPPPSDLRSRQRLHAAELACEKSAGLASKLDAIIKADRGEDR